MKKYFKTQLKKSVSLMLAVLMVLSCWVWIAPAEAKAADQHDGYYKVRVAGFVQDTMTASSQTWTVNYTGGSASLTGKDLGTTIGASGAPEAITNEAWIPSFPTSLYLKITVDKCGDRGEGRIENCVLQVYDFANSTWVDLHGQQPFNCADGDTSFTFNVDGNKTPAAASIGDVSSKTLSVEIPNITNTTKVEKSNTYEAKIYDQYGVWFKQYATLSLKSDDGSLEYKDDTYGFWLTTSGNGVIINTNYKAQQKISGDPTTKTATAKLYGSHSSITEVKELVTITLKYPTYKVSVDQKLSATMKFNNGTTQTTAWTSDAVIYGAELSKYPLGTVEEGADIGATKAGFTFKGYWTVAQPADGDASYNAESAKFAAPVDETTFNTYKAKDDSTVSGSYVTLADGSKYYNAGKKWDSEKDFVVTGDASYHGWWISKDIPVKFYNIDGTYLGTKTAKYGDTPAATWYAEPKTSYVSGAFTYKNFSGTWRDISGAIIEEGSYTFGDLESLTLTPIYDDKTYSETYTTTFINVNGETLSAVTSDYRAILDNKNIPTPSMPNRLENDLGYSYEFSGWTSQKPASGNYHTLAVGDTTITENTDWVVRADTTYYAVYRSTVKEYVVAFNYTDSTGAPKKETLTVPYGSTLSTPSVVNRNYAEVGKNYVLLGWYDANYSDAFDADAVMVFNSDNISNLSEDNLAPNGTPVEFNAKYDKGTPTPYTIKFKYKAENGVDALVIANVDHGSKITAEKVAELTVPESYSDGDALYTFTGYWKVTEGTAGKDKYQKDEFTSFSPTSYVTFEAIYGEGVPYYTVKYIDGAKTYEEKVLAGSKVPAWMVGEGEDAKVYVPTMAKTATGEYTFAGWFDAAQTDKSFEETNGNEYKPETDDYYVNADLTLYSQFLFSPFKFDVKFVNYDGTVFAEGEFEAGESFADIYDEAMDKAEYEIGKPADETYSFAFVGWDKKVPDSLVCEGKDITYTAQYRPAYIYYTARWYNDFDSMDDAVIEMEVLGEDGLLAITSHTYNGKIYAPSVVLTPPTGKVFTGWYYLKDGEPVKYERGMKITESMSFYARYDADAVVTYTVTAVVDGVETEYTVVKGKTAEAIGTPVNGYFDATHHRTFDGWYTAETCECEENCEHKFDLETAIEADTKIYARFTKEEHDKSLKELVTAPTYYEAGSEKVWCACNRGETEETVAIPVLTDTVAPTGTIYLGTLGSWSSEGTPASETDNDPVEFYANADTDIILTINDTGDVDNAYNPDGKGKGIAIIQGIISTGVFGADTTEITGIQTIYTNDDETLNNTANYVIKLGSYGLESGKTYIAYYYVKDKAGNVLNKNVRTAKFIYDNEAPVITLRGDDGSKKIPSFCDKAIIDGIENDAIVTVDGVKVELTAAGVTGKISYAVTEPGTHVVTVEDKAGNKATKKFSVADGHNTLTTSKDVTCLENGFVKVVCTVCGATISEETIEAAGEHTYVEKVVAPTCTEGGYTVNTCSVCGDEVKTAETPALDHVDQGTYIEVTKEATCSVKGVETTYCEACDAVISTRDLDPVETAHTLGNEKVFKPTCSEDGYYYQQCKYCYEIVPVEGKTISALNHENTGRYTVVTKTATCSTKGEKTTYCKVCDEPMGTEEIATISHDLKLVEYTAEADKSDEFPNGYKQYECQNTDCKHTQDKVAIEVEILTYTVTFKGAGENGADVTFTKNASETINIGDVADQTKASDNDYNYTFIGWKGTDGKVVKLPVTVTKNETYTAEFSAARRTYTHIFKVNAGDEHNYSTVIGFYNDADKKPAINPTKKATATETYEFAGWQKAGADVTDFTMTEDATFVAKFTAIPVEFKINFYNEGNVLLYSVSGDSAKKITYGKKDAEGNLIVPTKAPDADKHYTFAGWSYNGNIYAIDAEFTGFTSAARIYATYTAADHSFAVVNDATKTWAATCTAKGQKTEACTVCGTEKVTELPMIDHNYVLQADGSKVCSGCGDVIAAEAKEFTVTFNESVTYSDGAAATNETLKVYTVKEGTDKTYTAPEKDATAKYEYEFLNWTDAEGNVVSENAEITVTVTANVAYTANYKATLRSYTVTYVDADRNEIEGYDFTVAYGGVVPAAPAAPSKAYTKADHYVFDGWTVAAGTKVTGNILIQPVFKVEAHNWKATADSKDATCTENGGTVWACECGITETRGGKPATGHSIKETVVAPTENAEGYLLYTCENCNDYRETKPLPDNYFKITVKVLDEDGKPQADVVVKLLTEDGIEIDLKETNDKGIVEFTVEKNTKYKVYISSTGETKKVSVDEDGKVIGGKIESKPDKVEVEEDNSCKCACHKGTFWGIIFRLFQKIIKLFTGKATCCTCPSDKI